MARLIERSPSAARPGRDPRPGWRRRLTLRRFVLVALVLVALAALAGVITAVRALQLARQGAAEAARARSALLDDDIDRARQALEASSGAFGSARELMGSPLALPLRTVPLVGRQTAAATSLASGGELAAEAGLAGLAALEEAPGGRFTLQRGRVDPDVVRGATAHLERAAELAEQARDRVREAPTSWVLPPLAGAHEEALEVLDNVAPLARSAHRLSTVLPSLLGEDGPRRYLLAFANLSELRGSGGFIGFFAMVEADAGRLSLTGESGPATRTLRPTDGVSLEAPPDYERGYALYEPLTVFQNINLGVDFPIAGDLITQAAQPVLGDVDGVIQVDPIGASALLEMTGPVEVPSWPEPITADNVSEVAHHEMYVRYEGRPRARDDLNDELIVAMFDGLTSSDIELGASTLRALMDVVDGGHLRMYADREDEQGALEDAGIAGHLSRVDDGADVIGLVTENATPSKADWFLRREVTMEVSLDPVRGDAITRFQADLRNRARPDEGLDVVGDFQPAGTNRQLILIVQSQVGTVASMSVNGQRRDPHQSLERGMTIAHSGVDVAAGTTSTLTGELFTPEVLEPDGDGYLYRLHILRQPIAHPDAYDVTLEVPKGWKAEGPTRFVGKLAADHTFEVRLTRTLPGRLANATGGWAPVPLAILLLILAAVGRRYWQRRPRKRPERVQL